MNYEDHLSDDAPVPEGGFALLNHFQQNGARQRVTSAAFDPYEELLWTGNVGGNVVSHYSPGAEKYTGYRTNLSGTRDLLIKEKCVISISQEGIHGNERTGRSMFHHTSRNLTDLSCIHHMPNAPHTVVVGGLQQTIVQFDVETLKEQRVVYLKQPNCLKICSNDKFIFSSDTGGKVTLRNSNTAEPISFIDCLYQGFITDFDICGNSLISCGCSNRYNADMCVKIFDLRTLRLKKHVNLEFSPHFCRFIPSDENKVVAVSQCGQLQVIDTSNDELSHDPMQIESTFGVDSIAISPSKQCIAIGDDGGYIHLFSDRAQPVFHENPNPTEFYQHDELTTHIPITDAMTPLGIVNLPINNNYLSDWPAHMCQKTYREPDVINDRTYESMRMVQFIGYSRNPRAHTPLAGYNIIPYGNVLHNQMIRNMQNQEQQENMMLAGYATSARALSTPKSTPVKPMEIPKYYLNNQTNAAKNGFMNKSDKILIKNDISMPYAGSIIMAFYHVLPIRNVFLQHVCFDEHCLTCQIGFLYRVLSDKQTHYDSLDQPKTCPTVSIALVTQSLKTIKEANQIERVRTGKDGSSKFCEVAQKFIHFLVSHLQKEQDEFNSHRENIAETLGTFLKMDHEDNSRCLSCYSDSSDISSRTSSVIMKLIYPQQVGIHLEEKTTSLSFCHLIEQSILRKGQPAVGTCNHCDVFAEASMTRRVRQLPPVLLIDTDISNPEAQSFWRSQLKQIERKPNPLLAHGAFESRSPGRKPCRYGVDCRTINCHFHHPENDTYLSPTTGSPALRTTQSLPDLREWSHYLAPVIYVSCNKGLCTVSETYTGETNTVVYHLKSAVMSIGSPTADAHEEEDLIPTHLVTLVCTGARGGTPSEHLKNWVILNNETGAKIDEHKALNLDMRWKRPVMLTYVQIEHPAIKNLTEKRATIPKEVFWCGGNLATGDNSEVAKINIQNIPGEGDLVAFDAEFIQKGTCEDDKEQRAARVSCIDANGRILIDDYIQIANSNVYDYLTKFSGIVDEDLDPLKTTRYLTTQKYTYMKILCLVEQKVTFVGHGLDNDWTTLKLFPPPSQTRDTVYMFYQPSRLLSLSFLAWYFFGERIQQNEHCSVEDARMALRLYRHYTELDEKNQIAETIKTVYESAAKTNYKVPGDGSSPPPPEI